MTIEEHQKALAEMCHKIAKEHGDFTLSVDYEHETETCEGAWHVVFNFENNLLIDKDGKAY